MESPLKCLFPHKWICRKRRTLVIDTIKELRPFYEP